MHVGTAPVDLTVPAGGIAALLAPDRRSSTTTARVVAGLAPAVAGRVRVAGRDVTDQPPARRQIGYVPAGGALLPHLSVRRNIEYGLRKRERVVKISNDWVDSVVEQLNLAPTLDLLPHLLSDAQRFRVALARAVAGTPEVLVVDLPGTSVRLGRLADLLPRPEPSARWESAVLVCSTDRRGLTDLGVADPTEVGPVTGSGPPGAAG
ncbi:ATP-binding cassette domain-containing protein [Micromonospora sp. NPDC000207]|uniref:ATP-binding cassette domain-containing protein n=1 Tax=Micromonospora sp. NPDC000207 TaxID=3154246 RepID=UPI003326657A